MKGEQARFEPLDSRIKDLLYHRLILPLSLAAICSTAFSPASSVAIFICVQDWN